MFSSQFTWAWTCARPRGAGAGSSGPQEKPLPIELCPPGGACSLVDSAGVWGKIKRHSITPHCTHHLFVDQENQVNQLDWPGMRSIKSTDQNDAALQCLASSPCAAATGALVVDEMGLVYNAAEASWHFSSVARESVYSGRGLTTRVCADQRITQWNNHRADAQTSSGWCLANARKYQYLSPPSLQPTLPLFQQSVCFGGTKNWWRESPLQIVGDFVTPRHQGHFHSDLQLSRDRFIINYINYWARRILTKCGGDCAFGAGPPHRSWALGK